MPVIGRFRSGENIDERVQTPVVDTRGAGVEAEAFANIGKDMTAFGTELLRREKVAEAKDFTYAELKKKSVGSQKFWQQTTDVMDPILGTMPDKRKAWQHLLDWETDTTEQIADQAPTEFARRMFLDVERGRIEKRLLGAQANQRVIRRENKLNAEKQNFNDQAKALHATRSDADPSIESQAVSFIEENTKQIVGDIGDIISRGEAREKIRNMSQRIATSAVDGMMLNKSYEEAARAIWMNKLLGTNPQLGEDYVKLLKAYKVLKDGDKMIFDVNPATGKKEHMIYSPITDEPVEVQDDIKGGVHKIDKSKGESFGAFYSLSGKFLGNGANIPKLGRDFDFETIDIGADPKASPLVLHITPEFQLATAKKLLAAMADKRKKELQVLRTDHKNTNIMQMSTNRNNKLRAYPNSNDEATVNGVRTRIITEPSLTDVQKREMLGESYAAEVVGKMLDENDFMDRRKVQSFIDQVPNRVRETYAKTGLPSTETEMAGTIEKAIDLLNQNLVNETNMAMQDFGSYATSRDGTLKRDLGAIDITGADPKPQRAIQDKKLVESYLESARTKAEKMGLPLFAVEQKLIPAALMQASAETFRNHINTGKQDNYDNALAWLKGQRKRMGKYYPTFVNNLSQYGIDPAYQHALLMDDTVVGDAAAKRMLMNIGMADEIEKSFELAGRDEKELKKAVFSELSDTAIALQRKYPEDTGLKAANRLLEGATLEAKRIQQVERKNSLSDSIAAKQASNTIVNNHITTWHHGNGVVMEYNSILKSSGMNPEDPIFKKSFTAAGDKDFVVKYVDIEGSLPLQTKRSLDALGLKGSERKQKAYEIAVRDGYFFPDIIDGKYTVRYMHKNGESFNMRSTDGQDVFTIPLDALPLNKDIQGQGSFSTTIDSMFKVNVKK